MKQLRVRAASEGAHLTVAVAEPADAKRLLDRRPLSVLAVSPFSPYPQDAGQRKRVSQTLRFLKDAGCSVTLLLYAFEGAWTWRYQAEAIARIRAEHEDLLLLPATPKVGMPPERGDRHGLDEWWDVLLEQYIVRLLQVRHFDALFVNNVWLSKALTLVPPSVVRILDTHDVFHLRERIYGNSGTTPEFFRINDKDELFGIERADIVVSISLPEAQYLARALKKSRIVYFPYMPAIDFAKSFDNAVKKTNYLHHDRVVFGFLGTSHTFNAAGVAVLFSELIAVIGNTFAPIELIVAGTICDTVRPLAARLNVTIIGWVEREDEFYDLVDYFIVPVFNGTGFKVKVADIMQRGKPALFASHAAEGLAVDRRVVFDDAQSMARAMAHIALTRPVLAHYMTLMRESWAHLSNAANNGGVTLLRCINQQMLELVIDLRQQSGPLKPLALVSVFALARGLKDILRTRILVADVEPWLVAAASYLAPSITVETGAGSGKSAGKSPNRIWWRVCGDGSAQWDRPEGADLVITDTRFASVPEMSEIPGVAVISPDQAVAFELAGHGNWFYFPYLVQSTTWDPAARVLFRRGWDTGEAEAEGGPRTWPSDSVIVMVDDDHSHIRRLQEAGGKLGLAFRIIDLRDILAIGRMLAALYATQTPSGLSRMQILDGCTGRSPLRFLVLDMAILYGVSISTSAFGGHETLHGANMSHCLEQKNASDDGAFRALSKRLDAVRGRLRRL